MTAVTSVSAAVHSPATDGECVACRVQCAVCVAYREHRMVQNLIPSMCMRSASVECTDTSQLRKVQDCGGALVQLWQRAAPTPTQPL